MTLPFSSFISYIRIFNTLSKTITSLPRQQFDDIILRNYNLMAMCTCVRGPTLTRLAMILVLLSIGNTRALRVITLHWEYSCSTSYDFLGHGTACAAPWPASLLSPYFSTQNTPLHELLSIRNTPALRVITLHVKYSCSTSYFPEDNPRICPVRARRIGATSAWATRQTRRGVCQPGLSHCVRTTFREGRHFRSAIHFAVRTWICPQFFIQLIKIDPSTQSRPQARLVPRGAQAVVAGYAGTVLWFNGPLPP